MDHLLKFFGILALIWAVSTFLPYGTLIRDIIIGACIWVAVK